ncbi:lysozyme inhibitor LprI family protein [Methylomonas sp. AM2-LC]|uniref:lysozyme inhibitor LprI family protein n=1 Tax=Methylomonas sp. AM2-LC TaxID=3153301 RepID=UPI0032648C5D
MKKIILLLTLGFLPTTLLAENVLSEQYADCMDKTGGAIPEILNCISIENDSQDIRLNRAYKAAQTQLSSLRAKQLQEVQRIWIKYRNANCKFYADTHGATSASIRTNECLMNATASRALELENLKYIEQ